MESVAPAATTRHPQKQRLAHRPRSNNGEMFSFGAASRPRDNRGAAASVER